ncbi:MAG: hypothetical protein V3573_03285 [Desulfovibrionaceae bacterium]
MRYGLLSASILYLALSFPAMAQDAATPEALHVADTVSVSTAPSADAAKTTAVVQGQPGALDQVEAWINQNTSPEEGQGNATAVSSNASLPVEAGLVRERDMTQVNWGDGMISALGVAEVRAESYDPVREQAVAARRATLEARRQLQETVLSLPLDGRRLVGQALSPDQVASVRSKLQNSPLERRNEPDGLGGVRLEVVASAGLRGPLADSLFPPTEPFLSRVPAHIELTIGTLSAHPVDVDQAAYRRSMAELGAYTGVVVDARGLGVSPALLPVVAGPDGVCVFGPHLASRAYVVEQGLAVYAPSIQDPAARQRVGGTPLVVRALAVSGSYAADLVVSQQDADLIQVLFKSRDIGASCPMAIVLD